MSFFQNHYYARFFNTIYDTFKSNDFELFELIFECFPEEINNKVFCLSCNIKLGNKQFIEYLLNKDVPIDINDNSALANFVNIRDIDLLILLLKKNSHLKNKSNRSLSDILLNLSATYNNLPFIKHLVENGEDFSKNNFEAVGRAVMIDNLNIVQYFFSVGADPDIVLKSVKKFGNDVPEHIKDWIIQFKQIKELNQHLEDILPVENSHKINNKVKI